MSEFPGILSLVLIVAAFLTSCNNPQPTQGDRAPIAPFFSDSR